MLVKDECVFTAIDIFFHFNQKLLDGQYRITITGIKRNAEDIRSYFVLEDCYNNKYRLFVEKETDKWSDSGRRVRCKCSYVKI